MINLKEFILVNLKSGVKNGSFTKEYANILLANYSIKGIVSAEDIQAFSNQIEEEMPVPEEIEVEQ